MGERVTNWSTDHVRGHSFNGDNLSDVLCAASDWIAEAHEGDESIYGVISLSLHEDAEDGSYTLFLVYE